MVHFKRQYLGEESLVTIRRGWQYRDRSRHQKKMLQRYGVVISGRDLPDSSGGGISIEWPFFVEMTVKLSPDWDTYCQEMTSSAKRDLRRYRNSDLRFEVGDYRKNLAEFYHHYYCPSMISMHGEDAIVHSLKKIEGYFEDGGEYVEVWRGADRLGGYIGRFKENCYHINVLGWKDGAFELRRTGIVSALYIDALKRATQRGMRYFQMGGVPPYLENGLFVYKSKWNGRLDFERSKVPAFRAEIDPSHAEVKRFFSKKSLIVKDLKKQNLCVISERNPGEVYLRSEVEKSIGSWRSLDSL